MDSEPDFRGVVGRLADATAAGPFGDWPLARGFDRWYGFHDAPTDQWHPE